MITLTIRAYEEEKAHATVSRVWVRVKSENSMYYWEFDRYYWYFSFVKFKERKYNNRDVKDYYFLNNLIARSENVLELQLISTDGEIYEMAEMVSRNNFPLPIFADKLTEEGFDLFGQVFRHSELIPYRGIV